MDNKGYDSSAVEDIEIKLFLDGIYMRYDYNFKSYSMAHIKRRILVLMEAYHIDTISALTHRALVESDFFEMVLNSFSINVTEMFRDPDFFKYFREEIVPVLRTYPHIKIWHAGCSTGEEVYSMAILLKETELYDRCQIYATDLNADSLKAAKDGIYTIEDIKRYTKSYALAGGTKDFSDYYLTRYDHVIMHHDLKKNISFHQHNLVQDQSIGEMQIILCRNVMIYFDRGLQDKVSLLFDNSLKNGGFLCLGSQESLEHTQIMKDYIRYNKNEKVYQKRKGLLKSIK